MKILELRAENVQKLKAVSIKPDRSLVQITGENDAGKSSVLDAILWALEGGGALPAKPVRVGADKATVRLDLGDLVVTRTVKPDRASTLTVESKDGGRYPSPQAMLDKLLGQVSFDPLHFTRMDPAKQATLLRQLVPIAVDVDQLDRLTATDFDRRRESNRVAKERRAAAAAITVPDGLTDPVDFAAIESRLKEAQAAAQLRSDAIAEGQQMVSHSEQLSLIITEREARVRGFRQQIERLEQQIADTEREVGEMRIRHADLEAKIEDARAKVPASVAVSPILAEMSDARAEDGRRQERRRKAALIAEAEAAEQQSAAFTQSITDREAAKAKALAEAPFPVPGLGFSAEGVTLNGLPFEQASTALQIRASVAIGIASNPKIRVMRIKDGSLLDTKSMAELAATADERDFQIWIERVASGDSVGIEIADGSVAAVDGVPVAPATAEDARAA